MSARAIKIVNDRVATVPLLPDKPRHEKHGTSPLRLVPVGGCRRQQKDGGYGQVAEDLVARAQVAGEGWWLGSDCRDLGGKGTGCSQAGCRRRMVARVQVAGEEWRLRSDCRRSRWQGYRLQGGEGWRLGSGCRSWWQGPSCSRRMVASISRQNVLVVRPRL